MDFLKPFEAINWISGALALALIFVFFVILTILAVRQFISRKTLQAHQEVTGFVFTNLGVLFSVLLGFTVVNVQQRFDKIKETIEQEASYLSDLYQDALVFSPKDSELVQSTIQSYTKSVVEEEWEAMARQEPSLSTMKALRDIWSAYYQIELHDKKQEIWYAESIRKLNQLLDTRLSRIFGAKESLGTEMWTFLILGAVILVLFTAFFGIDNLTSHILLGAILALATSFLLFLIHSLDTAFTGSIQVSPEALQNILKGY